MPPKDAREETRTKDELQAAEIEQLEGKDPDALKKSRAVKMDEDEYRWVELKKSSTDIFKVPSFVLDAAAFNSQLDTTKPLKKSVVKAAVEKFNMKEVETG